MVSGWRENGRTGWRRAFPVGTRPLLLGMVSLLMLISSCDSTPERSEVELSDSGLAEAVGAMERGEEPPEGIETEGDLVRVEIHHDATPEEMAEVVGGLGGRVEGNVTGVTQALVPYDALVELEANPDVRFLQSPGRVDIPQDGKEAP